jgi:hypothetical protein
MRLTLLLIFLLLIQWSGAQLITRNLAPADDTYTYSDNTIRGMESLLKTYHSTAGSQYRRVIYLKFDISGLSNQINSSRVRLYCNGVTAGGDKAHIWDAYPVSVSTWSEDDLTFTNVSQKAGADVNTPVLASSATYDAGLSIAPGYIELSGTTLTQSLIDSVNAGKQYFSVRIRERNVVKNGTSGVIVDFHSKENSSGYIPELIADEKNVEEAKLADLKVDGVTIAGFNESLYSYTSRVEWNSTTIPVVTATARFPQATVTITPATLLSGTTAQRTTAVLVSNGENSLRYSVIFEPLPPPTDATLSGITIDGKALEFFSPATTTYTVYVPYSALTVPVVQATTNDPKAGVVQLPALQIADTVTEAERTQILNVTAANGVNSLAYKLIFQQLPELDIFLALGQSNMAGRANMTNEMMSPLENVYLLTPGGSVETASNPMNKYSNIRKDISLQKLGPVYSCALKLREKAQKPIAFVVNAQGGSSITVWYQAGKANYDASLLRAKEAQRWGKIKAIIWHQGESDGSTVDSYLSRLSTMVQNFRTDLNEPELFFVAGELGYWRGGGTASIPFNNMIQTIAGTISFSDWVSAEGGTPLNNDPADPHFDTASQLTLGGRYADVLIEQLYVLSNLKKDKKKDDILIQTFENGFTLQALQQLTRFSVYSITGQLIVEDWLAVGEKELIKLSKGVYIVNLENNDARFSDKIIIK